VTKLKIVISHLKTAPSLFIAFFITPGKPFQQEEEETISLSCHDAIRYETYGIYSAIKPEKNRRPCHRRLLPLLQQ
jgi:hypothetical protein